MDAGEQHVEGTVEVVAHGRTLAGLRQRGQVRVLGAGEVANPLGDHRIGLFTVGCRKRAGQFDLGSTHYETEHSAKCGEHIDVAQTRASQRFDEAFGGNVAGGRYGAARQHQWRGIGVLTHSPPDGGCDGFHVGTPIVGPAGQADTGEHRFGNEAFQLLAVFDVVVERHRSGTQCGRERSHAQAREPVLVDDLDRLRAHLGERESCPHVTAGLLVRVNPLTRTVYVS